jgi:hypothetical protein
MSSRSLSIALSLLGVFSISQRAFALTGEEQTARCEHIRDVAADNGISTGFLLAGIANAETNLSHCWTELDWACQGPDSPDCDGPVVAGAGDGPCSLQQGGLGMFQFDGGTFEQTIARDGEGVLLLDGNVTRGVDFVVNMLISSQYVDGVSNAAEAKAWMNQVTVDGPLWDAWIKTVTHYYNGCTPTGCSAYAQRYAHYSDNGASVYYAEEAGFWDVELPPCANVPADGRVLEETDTCFTKGGPLPYWRVGIGGENNLHVWTGTTAEPEAVNFVEWQLYFDEPGEYLLELSLVGGTSKQAGYIVEHAGISETVVVDQAAANGYVELGTFAFEAGDSVQRVYLADNTGEEGGERIVADALRVTRADGGTPPPGIDPEGEDGDGTTGGSSPEGGASGGGGDGDTKDDEGCSAAPGTSGSAPSLVLAIMVGVAASRARRRRP